MCINRGQFVVSLVRQIENQPFQPRYRGAEHGNAVRGWQERLTAYFWPNPANGLDETNADIAPLLAEGQALAQALNYWDGPMNERAVTWANAVLQWGRVPQNNVTANTVQAVIRAAITGNCANVPMNSGWTKVAAFATAHLENEGGANVIWDSRVSWSLVRRADALLYAAGHREVPHWLAYIGRVPGRGGTRWQHPLQLRWPYAYGSWNAHFAAACLIRDIRDVLNADVALGAGRTTAWTTREVEMVLFMDGY